MTSSAAAIERPADLELPSDLLERFQSVFTQVPGGHLFREFSRHLSEQGKMRFVDELLEAVMAAKERNDLRPVQDIMISWYRTSLFIADPGFLPAVAAAEQDQEIIDDEKLDKLLRI